MIRGSSWSRGGARAPMAGRVREEQIAGLGHDGGAAGADAVMRLEAKEAGEEIRDGDSGLEFGRPATSSAARLEASVRLLRRRAWSEQSPVPGIGEGMRSGLAKCDALQPLSTKRARMERFVDRIGVSRCVTHDMPRFSEKRRPTRPGPERHEQRE